MAKQEIEKLSSGFDELEDELLHRIGLNKMQLLIANREATLSGLAAIAASLSVAVASTNKARRKGLMSRRFNVKGDMRRSMQWRKRQAYKRILAVPKEQPTLIPDDKYYVPTIHVSDSPLSDRLAADGMLAEGSWEDIFPFVELLSTDQVAAKMGVARKTVCSKIDRHQILGLKGSKRGYRIPAQTLGDDGQPVTGLFNVITEIAESNHNLAWAFLSSTVSEDAEGGTKTVLDLLRESGLDAVFAAAPVFWEGFTA